jgi:hypothetical protein
MKKLGLIFGAAFFLLGGGGTWYFLQTPSASAATVAVPPAPDPVFVDLAPLVLPVIAGNNIEQLVQITITIEVSDEGKAARVRFAKPRLADAYLQDLYGALDQRMVLDGNMLDLSRLRDALTRASIGVLGENSFSKILIQRVSQRSL